MTSSNIVFAFAAYAIVWIVLFGYVFVLGRRLTQLETELRDLKDVPVAAADGAPVVIPESVTRWAELAPAGAERVPAGVGGGRG